MSSADPQTVRHRAVFYIPGFDPHPPRRYRELYRTESEDQAEISGYEITQSKPGEGTDWRVRSRIDGAETMAEIKVLAWADLVQSSMSQTIPATYWQLAKTSWIYIASGTLRRLMWLRKGPVIAALYPIAMLTAQLLLTLLVAGLAGRWLNQGFQVLTGLLGTDWAIWGVIGNGLGWAVLLVGTVLGLRFFRGLDHKLFAYYLMHDYAYTAGRNGDYPDSLQTRMDAFAEVIGQALAQDYDEVLVVGHSSGAHLAISTIADLARAGRIPANGPALSLLTLGHVVPMVSFLRYARKLRADLNLLSTRDDITWVDVTAPGDGCSFALCDPVSVSGQASAEKRWPLVISAAFTQTLAPDTWKAMRWRFFRLHFQYLCAFDNPGDYDYFQITAGPITLGQRFADRQPSKSRIDVPATAYTSTAA